MAEVPLPELYLAILEGQASKTRWIVEQALSQGFTPEQLLQETMQPAMEEVGRRFERNEYFIPNLLVSARAMKAGLELLRPMLAKGGTGEKGLVILGTVQGDLHDIGKNLVGAVLEGGGFRILDLGTNVSPAQFRQAVEQHHPIVLGLSALLTTTMHNMEAVLRELENHSLRSGLMIMVGGAAVSAAYAAQIGADGYGKDAHQALVLVKKWLATAGQA